MLCASFWASRIFYFIEVLPSFFNNHSLYFALIKRTISKLVSPHYRSVTWFIHNSIKARLKNAQYFLNKELVTQTGLSLAQCKEVSWVANILFIWRVLWASFHSSTFRTAFVFISYLLFEQVCGCAKFSIILLFVAIIMIIILKIYLIINNIYWALLMCQALPDSKCLTYINSLGYHIRYPTR